MIALLRKSGVAGALDVAVRRPLGSVELRRAAAHFPRLRRELGNELQSGSGCSSRLRSRTFDTIQIGVRQVAIAFGGIASRDGWQSDLSRDGRMRC